MKYIRSHQKQLRCELYSGLADALLRGETEPSSQLRRVVLPLTFTGGARSMIQNYQDAVAICKWIGYPDLFTTFTCNPKWPELVRFVDHKGLQPVDRPNIVCRIFKMKLDLLINDIKNKSIFGKVAAVIYTIEFQKRGLPHAHNFVFLHKEFKFPTANHIDTVISAEVPDPNNDPHCYATVRDFMIHGPCGLGSPNSPCMSNGRCTKHFPKKFVTTTTVDEDGYPVYRRRDNGHTILRNGIPMDNRYIVLQNQFLLLKYGGHINVEWCNQSRSIKYLFKCVNKGHDRVTASFYRTAEDDVSGKCVDEVSMYYDCRYISGSEAGWCIFKYDIQYRYPSVQRLIYHLEDQNAVIFSDDDPIDTVLIRPTVRHSMFIAWMDANKKKGREWKPRSKGISIGRLFYVPPGSGNQELYYLRSLLNIVRGATSYESLRCINGVQYNSYREACYALGLLDDDKEYVDGIIEASVWSIGNSLRPLFVTLLSSGCMSRPEEVWNKFWPFLCEDMQYKQRRLLHHEDLQLSDTTKQNYALAEIEQLLRKCGWSLDEFQSMPKPDFQSLTIAHNKLIHEELHYDHEGLRDELIQNLPKMNDEQRNVYDTVMNVVDSNVGGLFFMYGYGGTGKTFVWRTLSAAIRSRGDIVLNVASSGIASLLLSGGRTANSRFHIPINVNEYSMCSIQQVSELAQLIITAKLIIWDEAPMMQKYCFEALDKSLRDILRFQPSCSQAKPFGGK